MEDAISVTVIATGFNADGQIAKKNLTDAVSSASAPVAAKEEPKSTTKDKTDDDDDTFYDIMSIFKQVIHSDVMRHSFSGVPFRLTTAIPLWYNLNGIKGKL